MDGKNHRSKRIAVITAVIIIPLVYSFFYLWAFWDPYSKLQDLPVAVVNEDKGAQINGELRNAGNEFVDEISKSKDLKWVVTNGEEADNGLNNREFYAEIRIPEDFSSKIATATEKEKTESIIIYQPNEKRNFLAAQVLNRGILELKEKVSKKLTEEMVSSLTVEVKKLPDDLKEMNDKLGEASDGAKQLTDGLGELRSSQVKLNDGVAKLSSGLAGLRDGSSMLAAKNAELADGSGKLAAGSRTLSDNLSLFSGKLIAGLPDFATLSQGSNIFNQKLSELSNGAAQLNGGMVKLNAGLTVLNSDLNAPNGGLNEFANAATSFGKGLQMFSDGFNSAKAGSNKVYEGTAQYSASIKQYSDGLTQYFTGVKTLTDSDKAIAEFMTAYVKAHPEAMTDKNIQSIMDIYKKSQGSLDQLGAATDTLKTKSDDLVKGAQQLQAGSKELNDGMALIGDKSKELMSGANQLAAGATKVGSEMGQLSGTVKQLSDGSKQLAGAASSLAEGSSQLTAAYGQINGGIQKASQSVTEAAGASKQLSDGAKTVTDNLNTLSQGAASLADGAKTLNSGASQAYNGSAELNNNLPQFIDGESKLYDGANKLKDGLNDGHKQVSDALSKANDKMSAIDGLDKYAAEPVKIQQTAVNPVPDYGTAFAPYFMSLSLWIGALLMFYLIYCDPDIRFKRISKNSRGIVRFFAYPLLGIVQAVVLGFVVRAGLHLQVKDDFLYYMMCILVSLAFISIMQFLIINLADVGKFLAIVLLILQLTACGGTFPMELVPDFFRAINPFMPMTYSVNVFKEVISGIDYGFLGENAMILIGIIIAFLLASFLISKLTADKNSSQEEIAAGV